MPGKPPWPAYTELALIVDHLWGHAEAGYRHSVQPGEETLTDVAMLSQKRRRFPFTHFRGRLPAASSIKVHKFTNPQEGKTGADWNLLLIDASQNRVSFRIQAKNLYPSGEYSKMKPKQTDRLINMSVRQGAIPLFALYQGPQFQPDAAKGEARSACRLPGANDRMGCIVRDAPSLKAAKPSTRKKWQAEASLGLPLHCLVACFCHGGASGPRPLPPGSEPTGPPPPFAGPAAARSAIGRAALTTAREGRRSPVVIERLAAALDAPPPEDRIGDYWDRHDADLTDLDTEGSELFEDVSHIVVLDERE